MNIDLYEELTGSTVANSKRAFIQSRIKYTQAILEDLLGFTLDGSLYNINHYTETGKTASECPCPSDDLDLNDPDEVVFAYRLFPYNYKDKYLMIDPASEVHAVKLVKDGVTYKTFETDEYRKHYKFDLIKFLEEINCCWCTKAYCEEYCKQMQLAVDATWVWASDSIPDDLNYIWVEMIDYYKDKNKDVISQTLGSHSYRKDTTAPEQKSRNLNIIRKYAGPLGNASRIPTV